MEPSNKRGKISRLKKAYNKVTKLNTEEHLYAMHQLDMLKHFSEFDERWSYGENCPKCYQKTLPNLSKNLQYIPVIRATIQKLSNLYLMNLRNIVNSSKIIIQTSTLKNLKIISMKRNN